MDDLIKRLSELPCGRRLLDAAAGIDGVHLVGGAVRDLLLGRAPRELDVVVEGDVGELAARLREGAGDDADATVHHERFGTATVRADDCRWDLASARAESYARPGALPDVREADIEQDLRRRDVTINAIALELATGTLRAVPHALDDLRAGRLRVLHDRSFVDDATRLWRIARYRARLRFELEDRTRALAEQAIGDGLPQTLSGARIGNELRLALAESDPVAALRSLAALGLAPWLAADRELIQRALELLPVGEGRRDLLTLAAALTVDGDPLLEQLEFSAAERVIVRAAQAAPQLDDALRRPSELARALGGLPVEAVALAGARGAAGPARRWLVELRHVGLQITGDDLLAAGLPEGPEVGRRMRAVLDQRLDGTLAAGRDAELRAALGAGTS